MRFLPTFTVLCLPLLASLPQVARAAGVPDHEQDTRALQTFLLNAKNVDQVTRANEMLAAEAAKSRPLADAIHAQMDGAKSFQDSEAKMAQQPAILAVLKKAGLTPRQYILANATLQLASMQRKLSGKTQQPEGAALSARENVDFVAHHPAELKAYERSMEKLQGDAGAATP